ncbi:protein kinase 4-like [Diaphorina citri]|uniref:Protein kinase 4-like n=1 Tax=Diaphorina citri TaxID=121845 RepID=A0A1S3D5F7_DIACI|nr:protein kinase 4-like [Diaphorina citri]
MNKEIEIENEKRSKSRENRAKNLLAKVCELKQSDDEDEVKPIDVGLNTGLLPIADNMSELGEASNMGVVVTEVRDRKNLPCQYVRKNNIHRTHKRDPMSNANQPRQCTQNTSHIQPQCQTTRGNNSQKGYFTDMINMILESYIGLRDVDMRKYNYINELIAFVENLNRSPTRANQYQQSLTELIIQEIEDVSDTDSTSAPQATTSNQIKTVNAISNAVGQTNADNASKFAEFYNPTKIDNLKSQAGTKEANKPNTLTQRAINIRSRIGQTTKIKPPTLIKGHLKSACANGNKEGASKTENVKAMVNKDSAARKPENAKAMVNKDGAARKPENAKAMVNKDGAARKPENAKAMVNKDGAARKPENAKAMVNKDGAARKPENAKAMVNKDGAARKPENAKAMVNKDGAAKSENAKATVPRSGLKFSVQHAQTLQLNRSPTRANQYQQSLTELIIQEIEDDSDTDSTSAPQATTSNQIKTVNAISNAVGQTNADNASKFAEFYNPTKIDNLKSQAGTKEANKPNTLTQRAINIRSRIGQTTKIKPPTLIKGHLKSACANGNKEGASKTENVKAMVNKDSAARKPENAKAMVNKDGAARKPENAKAMVNKDGAAKSENAKVIVPRSGLKVNTSEIRRHRYIRSRDYFRSRDGKTDKTPNTQKETTEESLVDQNEANNSNNTPNENEASHTPDQNEVSHTDNQNETNNTLNQNDTNHTTNLNEATKPQLDDTKIA